MNAQKIALYESTVARLEVQIAGHLRMRKSLIWVLYGTLVATPILFFAVSKLVGLVVVVGGMSTYGVGRYIAMVHFVEDSSIMTAARATIEELRARGASENAAHADELP